MFCNKCGMKVEENQQYCGGCGNPLQPMQIASNKDELVFNKQELERELYEVVVPLQKIEEHYKRCLQLQKQIETAEKNSDFMVLKLVVSIPAGIILGYIVFAFVFVLLGKDFLDQFPSEIILLLIFFGMVQFGIGIYLLMHFSLKGVFKKNTEKNVNKLKVQIDENQKAYYDLSQIIYPTLKRYLPEDYWYSQAVSSIAGYFRTGRASTIKEALNLYEEEMHRLRMENMQEQTLRQSQKQTAYAAITAWNTSLTAMDSVSNFFR